MTQATKLKSRLFGTESISRLISRNSFRSSACRCSPIGSAMARCSCISCSGKWPFEVAAANLSGASDHSTSRHHSQIVSWTFATCARGVARRRSAPLKKKRRRASGRLIAEARGSLACTANSERRYATGNYRIGDCTQRCRSARLPLFAAP